MKNLNNSTNIFENFIFEFADTLYKYKDKTLYPKVFIDRFKKDRLKEDLELSNTLYSVCKPLWDQNTPFKDWIRLVNQYSEFIRSMEKCFMYRNESSIEGSNVVYSEFDSKEKSEILYFRFLDQDVKMKFTFKKSMINNIVSDNDESNLLKNYLEGKSNSNDNQYVTFINIFISREFGKQVCNEFNFIYDEEPIYNDYTDEVLMKVIKNMVSNVLKDNLEEIAKNIIKLYGPNCYYDCSIEGILNGKFIVE